MTLTAKPRKTSKKPPVTKTCLKCGNTKKLTDFYANKDWIEQAGKDVWCKSCVAKCRTKDEIREYFWNNNREFKEELWEMAQNKARQELANVPAYQRASEDRKAVMLDTKTCDNVPGLMSLSNNYKFVDNYQNPNVQSYEQAKKAGHVIENKVDKDVKTYSHEFNGDFKPAELAYLEEYYAGLGRDFNLSDTSLRDNAKKLAKASLLVDKAQDAYMSGRGSLQDVKDATSLYDLLSKSGNFAACKRSPEDKGGLGSWGELSLYLETHGHPMTRKIEWPEDDIDRVSNQYRHLIQAIGLDQT